MSGVTYCLNKLKPVGKILWLSAVLIAVSRNPLYSCLICCLLLLPVSFQILGAEERFRHASNKSANTFTNLKLTKFSSYYMAITCHRHENPLLTSMNRMLWLALMGCTHRSCHDSNVRPARIMLGTPSSKLLA